MPDATLEAQDAAAAAVAVAPRVSLADIEDAIASEHYLNAGEAVKMTSSTLAIALDPNAPGLMRNPLDLLTICVLVLKNGFTVMGESACASPENYDEALGRTIARRKAIEACWPLFGFALRDRLALR